MDSPGASITRDFRESRHEEQSGSGNFGFVAKADRDRLGSVEEWKGLPSSANSTQAATHGHKRCDTLPQDTVSAEASAGSGSYHSMGGREPDRNATSRQHQQGQQNDLPRGVGGYYRQVQRSDHESMDSQERRGSDYLNPGWNSNRQVEQFSGPEHPTGPPTRLAPLASNGWTPVNSSSYSQQHTDGPRTVDFANHIHNSPAVRDAGAVATSEEFSTTHPQVGAEELRKLQRKEASLLDELDRIREEQKKLREQLDQRRLLSSPQPTPARCLHIAGPDQDVEMLDCGPSSRWSAQATPSPSVAVSARTVSVLQLLNADDLGGSIAGPTGLSPSTNTNATPHMTAVQEESAEDLFLPPKSGSPPLPRWQFTTPAGVTDSPRIKSTTTTIAINSARGSRPQSWYNNRMKLAAHAPAGKEGPRQYKVLCPHCQSSFRLPCQLR